MARATTWASRLFAISSRSRERSSAPPSIGDWQPTLSDHGEPERVRGDRVSWTYFRTLGVQPAFGRDFLESEDLPGNNQVVILSHGLWQRRFGGDSSIVGKAISIDGNPMTVVGRHARVVRQRALAHGEDLARARLSESAVRVSHLSSPANDRAHAARREPECGRDRARVASSRS